MQFYKFIMAQKWKFVLLLIATVTLVIMNFPLSESSDKITSLIYERTDPPVWLQFNEMAFTMIPQPAVQMKQVVIETPFTTDLTIDELNVAPSIIGMIGKKPAGHATASGLFGGELDLDVASSGKIKAPQAVAANLTLTDFQLKDLFKSLQLGLPLSMAGQGRLIASVDVDPSMQNQPEGDVDLQVNTVNIASLAIPIQGMPPFVLPSFNLEKLILKGKLKNRTLTLSDTQIGSSKDDLSAKVSGTLDVTVRPNGSLNVGLYKLAVDLNIKESGKAKLGASADMIDLFLNKYGSASTSGKRYAFRIQGNGFGDSAPTLSGY